MWLVICGAWSKGVDGVADADPFSWARSLCLRTAGVLASRFPASTSSTFVGDPHFLSFLTFLDPCFRTNSTT